MKNFLVLTLALLALIVLLYAGLNGLMKNHSYGFFFTFIGAITTVGLGLDVVNHLKIHIRKNNVRKLGRL
jgi:Trk-type K+ transport system membrane component